MDSNLVARVTTYLGRVGSHDRYVATVGTVCVLTFTLPQNTVIGSGTR